MPKLRLGVLIHDEFPELDLWYPIFRYREEDANPLVVGLDAEKGYLSQLGYAVMPDIALKDAKPENFDVIVVPGGQAGASIGADETMVGFIRDVAARGGVIAAVSTAVAALHKAGLSAASGPATDDGVAINGKIITASTADSLPAMLVAIAKVATPVAQNS
jgi:protease I